MGRERSRKMERFFLYLACSLILLVWMMGCASSPRNKLQQEELSNSTFAREGLAAADAAVTNEDYPLALQKNAETAAHYPGILEDQILFQRGLIHAHPRNPEQNFTRAIEVFKELREKFSGSSTGICADAWILTIENILEKEAVIDSLKKDLQKREKTIARLNTQTGPRQAQIKQLNSQVSQLENQVLHLESQLEKLKKVDLGIEEKKRTGAEH